MNTPLPHVVTVLRYVPGGEDPYGDPITVTERHNERAFFGVPSTTDLGAEPQRFATMVPVVMHPDADIESGDDIEWDQRLWRVVGEPLLMTNLNGVADHYEVQVAGYASEELVGS